MKIGLSYKYVVTHHWDLACEIFEKIEDDIDKLGPENLLPKNIQWSYIFDLQDSEEKVEANFSTGSIYVPMDRIQMKIEAVIGGKNGVKYLSNSLCYKPKISEDGQKKFATPLRIVDNKTLQKSSKILKKY